MMVSLRRMVAGFAAMAAAGCLLSSCAGGSAGDQAAVVDANAGMVATGEAMNAPLPATAADTRLVNQDGHAFTLGGLRGKAVVIAPLLTFCQETCPMTSANMHQAARDALTAGLGRQVVFLEITVDPARDTVRRLHAYGHLYGPLPDWQLATGKPAAVKAMWKAVGVSTTKAGDDTVRDWMTGKIVKHSYDVHHQDLVMIVDAAGHLRWMKIGHPDARGSRVPKAMRRFLNEEGIHNLQHPSAGGADTWTASQVDKALTYVRHRPHNG